MNMEVTKRAEFSCCYIQDKQIEAHHCKVEVTVEGPQRFEDFGRVITYENLQNYLRGIIPNRAFLYCKRDYNSIHVADAFNTVGCKTVEYNFDISAENLCRHLAETLQDVFDELEPGISILEFKLREDNNSFVSWKRGNM